MSVSSIISMLAIIAVVLGGFLYFLTKAIKKEKEK
ncbi:MetS family NSS transporter small subunit [Marinoscillum furvescens]|uniref:Uncharacterized protein n=1 Tax=Marinoscillum furvescens DSM 4134 TaxID=1122208 RepID=A0A3D9L3W0_MARFU|nr:MetS family NSS transporter small subunit [Marinoscillum furvescens]RED97954.1 hypothetical protein C7460_11195 [Marinoscillum furvescens DSM 4134]